MKVKLIKLKVQTKLGFGLGIIKNIIFDTESREILQYEVGGLFGKKYLISRDQVISIDNKKMIVDDSVVEIENKKVSDQKINMETEGVAMD